MRCTFAKPTERMGLVKTLRLLEGLKGLSDALDLPLIGFDIETYSPKGFPVHRQDPIVTATLAISPSLDLRNGLILISMIFPPSMEDRLLTLLHRLFSTCEGGSMVTYNGKRFDLIYTTHRGRFHGLNFKETFARRGHLDMYEIVRNTMPILPSYGQKAVEEFLGIERSVSDLCGATYHQAFNSFLSTGSPKPLLYNIEDSIGCLRLLNLLTSKGFNGKENNIG